MSIYSIKIGDVVSDLSEFKDQYVLVVNIADKCGFSPQLHDLERLHQNPDIACVVIAFPSNQFNQQSRDDAEMQVWCEQSQGLSFPVESQIQVNGENAHPLFQYLKKKAKGALGQERVTWNYTKFLIYPNETKIKRFSPQSSIEKVAASIET
ncbi:MAG: glutathione peroxidase [Pseudomonadota bacterium]|nr:glutathione peroxidase [Pseudomonadota bacterium]